MKHGESVSQGKVAQRRLNGHITGNDLMKLEKLKNTFFPDYDKLKKSQAEKRMQEDALIKSPTP